MNFEKNSEVWCVCQKNVSVSTNFFSWRRSFWKKRASDLWNLLTTMTSEINFTNLGVEGLHFFRKLKKWVMKKLESSKILSIRGGGPKKCHPGGGRFSNFGGGPKKVEKRQKTQTRRIWENLQKNVFWQKSVFFDNVIFLTFFGPR